VGGGIKRGGGLIREGTSEKPYFSFEITKSRYEQGGRALLA
jgi:N-acetyltransferase